GVRLMVLSSSGEFETKEMYFTAAQKESRSFRGFEPKETVFAFVFEDKWGNASDTAKFATTPFYETVIQKPYADFRASIPYDNTSNLPGWDNINLLWDNIVNTNSHGWLTNPGSSGLSIT